ncbi:MAG: hypothetical protein AB1468_04860 [Candidatus Micrarchaeota archaeon]
MQTRSAAVFLFLMMLAQSAQASFELSSFSVTIQAYKDGRAHVTEVFNIFLTDSETADTYERAKGAINLTVESWRAQTNLQALRYYVSNVDASSVILKPQRIAPPNPITGARDTSIIVEYDTLTPLFNTTQTKPRTTHYELDRSLIVFESSASGEIIIPEKSNLTIIIPKNAMLLALSPQPDVPSEVSTPSSTQNVFTWLGRSTLTRFSTVFETEETLESEVIGFFRDSQARFVDFITSIWGVLLVLVALIALAAWFSARIRGQG